jgi:hypothetical protein
LLLELQLTLILAANPAVTQITVKTQISFLSRSPSRRSQVQGQPEQQSQSLSETHPQKKKNPIK